MLTDYKIIGGMQVPVLLDVLEVFSFNLSL